MCVHRIGHCQVQIFHILGVEYHEHNELLFLLLYCINTCKVYRQIYLLTAIGLTPGGSSTVHIYTQTIHRTTQLTTLVGRLFGIRNQSGQNKINDELTA